jgi:hypothetical protein
VSIVIQGDCDCAHLINGVLAPQSQSTHNKAQYEKIRDMEIGIAHEKHFIDMEGKNC